MTKYVVSGYIGFDNFGDEAIAKVLTSYLKFIGAEEITLISSNPQKTSKIYGVSSVKMLNFLPVIKNCDVLISGGGSLLQDITSLKSLIYYLLVITTALLLRKKVVIFAQGFTPFRTKIGEFLTKLIIKKCDKISVRDENSKKILNSWGINCEQISDPVFGIEVPKIGSKEGVGIQLRYTQDYNPDFFEKLADKIVEYFGDKKIKLISLQDSLDINILEDFSKMLRNRGVDFELLNDLSVENVVTEISKLEYLIGMRFHALLIASIARVKTLGLIYDIKVENLSKQIGFASIKMQEEMIDKGLAELFSTIQENYNIPIFEFPKEL